MEKDLNYKKKNKSVIFVFFILCFLIFIYSLFFIRQEIYSAKSYFLAEEILFSVKRGETIFQIAENLEQDGLIKNRFFFKIYVFAKGGQKKLKAGKYFLTPNLSVNEIAQKIILGDIAKVAITIPEGFTVKQIEREFNLDLPGENLEGFLFPDTYYFPVGIKGEDVVKEMQNNFNRKITVELAKEIERQNKTIFEIITMASIIEKEVRAKEEKELASGVLWKRLETGMPLQVDATIAYALDNKEWTFDEMRREIAAAKNIDSLYNTYKYKGLPFGPICNPGLESIVAAIYPQGSSYWYYLSSPEGKTYFSETLQEHNIKKAKYLK